MQVYRLAGIDPEPVVKTLMEIGNLDPATRLEVDKKNSAIIAYASLADHVTIRAVVDKLSGSERKFEVIRLRRLAADYVAGTIDFMMGSGTKKEKSRPNPFFGRLRIAATRRQRRTPRSFASTPTWNTTACCSGRTRSNWPRSRPCWSSWARFPPPEADRPPSA